MRYVYPFIASALVMSLLGATVKADEEYYMTVAGERVLGKIVEGHEGKQQFATCAGNLYPIDEKPEPTSDLCPKDPGVFAVVQDVKIESKQIDVKYDNGLVKTWNVSDASVLSQLKNGTNVLVDVRQLDNEIADVYVVTGKDPL